VGENEKKKRKLKKSTAKMATEKTKNPPQKEDTRIRRFVARKKESRRRDSTKRWSCEPRGDSLKFGERVHPSISKWMKVKNCKRINCVTSQDS
jgi:hypothetical protein